MKILSQDKNVIFDLNSRRGTIYASDVYHYGKYYGTNIYGGKLIGKPILLGTYEEGEAAQIINEIFLLQKAGCENYFMPAPSIDIEDL